MQILKYYSLIILIILSTIDRIGYNYLSINLLDFTIRYFHILSIIPAIILINSFKINRLIFYYSVCVIISGIINTRISSSISLIFALFISFYIFYLPAVSFAKQYPNLGVKAILQSSRIIMLIGIVLHFSGYTERMSAFFYEPSYMSIFMAAYASICFTEKKMISVIDFILIIIFLFASKSAAFLLILFAIAIYLLIIKKEYIFKYIVLSYVTLLIYLLIIEKNNLNYNMIESIIKFDINNLYEYSKQRSGERYNLLMNSYNEAIKSPIFGIGARTFQNIYFGTPPVNIFFTIILEAGILGLIICIVSIKNFYHSIRDLNEFKSLIICASFALLVCLQIESTYLRAYLWVMLGIFNGIIINKRIS